MTKTEKKLYSQNEIAKMLNITPARASQKLKDVKPTDLGSHGAKLYDLDEVKDLFKDNVININADAAAKLRKQEAEPSMFELNSNGGLKNLSVKNIVLILKTDKNLKGLFQFNEFTNEVDVMKDCRIETSFGSITIKKGQYTDQVMNDVELYIEASKGYGGTIFRNSVIDQGITNEAHMSSYNPVIDYMNEAYKDWDHKQRIDDFFPTYLGAEKNEANSFITELWFMGVVAKAYDPTTKFDFVLDLVGGQGAGKTTAFQKLAPLGFYTDQFNSFTNKDDFEVMKNALIINDDEMAASNSSSFEEIKRFITMQEFEYRKSYAKKSERFLKKFVMVRTTNEVRHLKDRSGDRRFMTIYANKKRQKKHPVTDLHPNYVKQLWGEAVWLFKHTDKPFELNKRQEDVLRANREQFRYTSALEDQLLDVLENDFKGQDFIQNKDLSLAVFKDPGALSRNNKEARDIRYYMEHLDYDVGVVKKINGKAVRGFEKSNG